jgi:hypothetical protein
LRGGDAVIVAGLINRVCSNSSRRKRSPHPPSYATNGSVWPISAVPMSLPFCSRSKSGTFPKRR